jgi:GPH family glycoside/pentoside/hexuronide:cation symporter
MIPILVFTPLARKMVVKYGKKELSVFGAIFSIIGGLGLFIITPDNTGLDLLIYIVCQLIFSLGLGIYSTVSWAMMGDAIDYNEWKFGTREEGTVYSLHSFFRKLAQGIGPSVVLLIMGWLGYQSKYGTVGQTAETAHNMCWLVAGLYLFSAILQFIGLALIYNLDRKMVDKMGEELKKTSSTEE